MGGNAVPNVRRYAKDEYESLCVDVVNKLKPNRMVRVLRSVRNKETFGDMDVLVSSQLEPSEIQRLFAPNTTIKNGPTISFDYKELQIDLIYSPLHEFEYSYDYGGNSDVGNFIGKIARRFGLKHGHDGLWLPIRDGNHMYAKICLTLDHDETLAFLDLSPDFGDFGSDEEVYEYVAKSKYFDPAAYSLENLSYAGRIRDKKRPSYQKFLKFCEEYKGEVMVMNKDKTTYLPMIFEYFPDRVHQEYKKVMTDLALSRYVRQKFNGEIVGGLTGLTGKELGGFISHLKTLFVFDMHQLVLPSKEQIEEKILSEFSTYQKL